MLRSLWAVLSREAAAWRHGIGTPPTPHLTAAILPRLAVLKRVPTATHQINVTLLLSHNGILSGLRSLLPGLSRRIAAEVGMRGPTLPTPAFVGRFYGRSTMNFRTTAFFGAGFPHMSSPATGLARPGARNFTSGFAHTAYHGGGAQTTSSLFNSLAGLKAASGAFADEVKDQKIRKKKDSLKERIFARGAPRPSRRASSRKFTGSLQPTHMTRSLKRVVDTRPGSLLEVVEGEIKCEAACVRPSRVKCSRGVRPVFTSKATGSVQTSVEMSIFLYGPPAWEMQTIQSPGHISLTKDLIHEIRTIGTLHRDHLVKVAGVLQTLLDHGLDDLTVVEEDGAVYELKLAFPRGYTKVDAIDCLLVLGIDPGSPDFRLEVNQLDNQVVPRASSSFDGSDNPEMAFPWPKAHWPGSSMHLSDVPECASDFLEMVECLMGVRFMGSGG
ncbi:hypothetical protein HKX48_001738 [Thoreauomyces humboldtii]|nr:hypothetical protein HKX48_001738 [Thoreauomyces humboldtii]